MSQEPTHTVEKILLWLGVLTFGGFGVAFIVAFDPLARGLGITTGDTGKIDLIAIYSGFEIGFAIFLAMCALRPERLRLGLIASGLAFAGFGTARAGALAFHHAGAASFLWFLLAVEVLGTALSFWAASRVGPAPRTA
jgi:hypothetical protein